MLLTVHEKTNPESVTPWSLEDTRHSFNGYLFRVVFLLVVYLECPLVLVRFTQNLRELSHHGTAVRDLGT